MLPQDFINRMRQMLGDEFPAFLESYEKERYQALRVNRLKVQIEAGGGTESEDLAEDTNSNIAGELGSLLNAERGLHLTPVPWASDGFYYDMADTPGRHPYHEAGVYYIQEPSAMAPAAYLMEDASALVLDEWAEIGQDAPAAETDTETGGKSRMKTDWENERILDLCAAPGGKSTQIASYMQGRGILVCNEIHPARAKILSENVERMGIRNAMVTNETPQRLAEHFSDYFTRILVDAPCSGEGMFRKNEDACGEWSLSNVKLCAERQDEILDCAASMLAPGGKLVYSTCTFAPAENEGSIARFLERHPEFAIEEVPLADGMRGGMPEWAGDEMTVGVDCEGVTAGADCAGMSAGTAGTDCAGEETAEPEAKSVDEDKFAQLTRTIRLWPHLLNGEGHYLAVLRKSGELCADAPGYCRNGVETGIAERDLKTPGKGALEFLEFEKENLKASISGNAGELRGRYLKFGDQLYLIPKGMPSVKGLKVLRPGLHLGTLKKNRFEPSHALALALSAAEVLRTVDLASESADIRTYLNGGTFPLDGEKGWYLVTVDGYSIGWGKLAGGILKNHYPKGLRKNI